MPSRPTILLVWACLQNLLAADVQQAFSVGDLTAPDLFAAYDGRELPDAGATSPECAAAAILQRTLDTAGGQRLSLNDRARLSFSLTAALGYRGSTVLDMMPERNSPGTFPPVEPGETRAAYLVRVSEWAKRAAREVLYAPGGGMRVARNVGWFYGYHIDAQSLRHLAAAAFATDLVSPDAPDAQADRHTQVRKGIDAAAVLLQVAPRCATRA